VAGGDPQAEGGRRPGSLDHPGELARAVPLRPRLAIASGVQLDGVRVGALTRLHLFEVGVDEEGDLDARVPQGARHAANLLGAGDDVEAALGGELLARALRDAGIEVSLFVDPDL